MVDKTNYAARNPHLGGTMNPFATKNSASRNAMWSTNQPQTLTLLNSDPKQITNGADIDLANAVWDIRSPCRMRVLHVQHREISSHVTDTYIRYQDLDALEDDSTNIHGILHIPSIHSSHVRYGFSYVYTKNFERIEVGSVFEKGTVFATSPNVKADGQYGIGKEANFAFISTLITHEDGVGMCKEDRYGFQSTYTAETIIPVNEDEILLNTYGDEFNYRPFPAPGEKVRSDGLLSVSRKLRKRFMPLQTNRVALKDNVGVFDKPKYILPANEGVDANGQKHVYYPEVVNIEIIKNLRPNRKSKLPDQLERYLNGLWLDSTRFYRELLAVENKLGGRAFKTPELEVLIDEATMNLSEEMTRDKFGNFKQQLNRKVIDDYYVKITTKSTLIPTIGYKYTDLHGGKFVVCGLYAKEDCPTDQWGRHATFWASPESVSNRNNPGQLHEMIYTDSAFHTRNHLLNLKEKGVSSEELWETYSKWVSLISQDMTDVIKHLPREERGNYLEEALRQERLGVYITNESRDNGLTLLDKTEGTPFFPPRGPIRYTDDEGVVRNTKAPIRISNKYIVLLEKDGGYFSAASAPKRGPTGISAKLSSEDKKNAQVSEQSARVGEAEYRNMACYIGAEATARYYAQSNSAVNLTFTIDRMLRTDTPTYLPEGENRYTPTTLNRGAEMFHHYIQCFGVDITNE